MALKYVVPAVPGERVPLGPYARREFLPDDGLEVDVSDPWWVRRLAAGEVEIVEAPKKAQTKAAGAGEPTTTETDHTPPSAPHDGEEA